MIESLMLILLVVVMKKIPAVHIIALISDKLKTFGKKLQI